MCKGAAHNLTILQYSFFEIYKSDGTNRSISSSFCFKLRRYTACTEADVYNKESWRERTDQNGQRQGKNRNPNRHDDDK